MNENKEKKEQTAGKGKKIDIVGITMTAAVIALVALLAMTPLGYMPVGSLQITTVHVLVIVIAIIFGLKYGLIAGLTFGVTSVIVALTSVGLFTPLYLNPIVSILPRLLLPIVAYYVFHFMYRIASWRMHNKGSLAVAAVIAAIVSTLVHSITSILFIWIFHWMSPGLTDEALLTIIMGLLTVNVPLEILFAAVVAGIIVPILYPWFNRADFDSKAEKK